MKDSINLAELNVLALDCQATGANPGKGRMLELGWVSGCAASLSMPETDSVESYLIRLPPETTIPPVVHRLTGISETDMSRAVAEKSVWGHLSEAVRTIAARNPSALCPTVIHFARFERPFLREMHAVNQPGTPFPFHIICTHAIAKRLLPWLPRRGIRALAGYLGHSMPELKRSADHALATLHIWKALVELLRIRCKVTSLPQLTHWLSSCPVPGRTKRTFPMNPAIRLGLPDHPGVYRMLRSNDDILYIGKAKSIRQRVNSYFQSSAAHPEHILEMLSQARNIDFTLTESALEAALLESDEIKRRCPPYNKALRPNQRSIVFCTRDFKKRSTRSDRRFCIGPLPEGRLIEALEAFETWLARDPGGTTDDELSRIGYAVLALPPAHAPDFECLAEGLDLFRDNHRHQLRNRSALRIVTALGAQFRIRQLAATAAMQADEDLQAGDDDSEMENGETAKGSSWTPAAVAGAVESMLTRCAHLIRRARWYGLLSESCMAWASVDNPDELRNLIVFERGKISYRVDLNAGRRLTSPPGFSRPWHERRNNLDLVTYDRMRVVTTELRRLVCAGRRIELHLGPGAGLTSSRLKKALLWV